jgi:hypothetical protein
LAPAPLPPGPVRYRDRAAQPPARRSPAGWRCRHATANSSLASGPLPRPKPFHLPQRLTRPPVTHSHHRIATPPGQAPPDEAPSGQVPARQTVTEGPDSQRALGPSRPASAGSASRHKPAPRVSPEDRASAEAPCAQRPNRRLRLDPLIAFRNPRRASNASLGARAAADLFGPDPTFVSPDAKWRSRGLILTALPDDS